MSTTYKPVTWNRHKRIYDACIVAAIVLYLAIFVTLAQLLPAAGQAPDATVTLMRATGTAAAAMLAVILCIGPLARLDTRLLPLLYNRRHLGVATFILSLLHVFIVVGYYHTFGDTNPFISVLVNTSRTGVPFEYFGIGAFAILFLMAATSHDFWLANLGPRIWKTLHMCVYLAFALIILHIAFGALQSEPSPVYPVLLGATILTIAALHIITGRHETKRDNTAPPNASDNWIDAGPWRDIPESRAKVICPAGAERVAIFRHDGRLSAVANVCAHQQGPLGEGRVIDGCITCPWHGYQYRPEDGQSPPPFTEKIPTYELRLEGDHVLLNPNPKPPGTPIEPTHLPAPTNTPAP